MDILKKIYIFLFYKIKYKKKVKKCNKSGIARYYVLKNM